MLLPGDYINSFCLIIWQTIWLIGIKCFFFLFKTFVQNNFCLINTVHGVLHAMYNMLIETCCNKTFCLMWACVVFQIFPFTCFHTFHYLLCQVKLVAFFPWWLGSSGCIHHISVCGTAIVVTDDLHMYEIFGKWGWEWGFGTRSDQAYKIWGPQKNDEGEILCLKAPDWSCMRLVTYCFQLNKSHTAV
jgi:hypothetical protein